MTVLIDHNLRHHTGSVIFLCVSADHNVDTSNAPVNENVDMNDEDDIEEVQQSIEPHIYDNSTQRLLQLRSGLRQRVSVEPLLFIQELIVFKNLLIQVSSRPNSVGHLNIYLRKDPQYDRNLLQQLRVPAARYDRRRQRMKHDILRATSLNYLFHSSDARPVFSFHSASSNLRRSNNKANTTYFTI